MAACAAALGQDLAKREGLGVVPLYQSPAEIRKLRAGAECLEKGLAMRGVPLEIVPDSAVRNAVFPWFEAGRAPATPEALGELLRSPAMAERLRDIRVRLLLFPTFKESKDGGGPFFCGGNAMFAGCLGVATFRQESTVHVAIWDAAREELLGDVASATSQGTSWIVGYILPVWYNADTSREACAQAASNLADYLLRR